MSRGLPLGGVSGDWGWVLGVAPVGVLPLLLEEDLINHHLTHPPALRITRHLTHHRAHHLKIHLTLHQISQITTACNYDLSM